MKLRTKSRIVGVLGILVALIAAFIALAWRSAIDPVRPPGSFDRQVVERGAELEAIGDCNTCHTAPGGRAYAGGRGIRTPFGTVYSTNITPDSATGIGSWSEQAFVRAMREGVDREGRHLYPVFPYDHFNLAHDADLHALYAFLMTRDPVSARAPANDLMFPLGFRPLLAGWKLLFLREREFQEQPSQSAEWNRGAYLAEGPGHCGACHTPRNALGAVRRDKPFAGGQAEGWDAPALDASSTVPLPWTRERLIAYLQNVVFPGQGIPAGPMLPVAHNLAVVPDADVKAIATYIASVAGATSEARERRAAEVLARVKRDEQSPQSASPPTAQPPDGDDRDSVAAGAHIYSASCALCHGAGRGIGSGNAMHLAQSTSISLPSPTNLIHIVEDGVRPRPGERGRWMPAFRGSFTDAQLGNLLIYLRTEFGPGVPWRDVQRDVRNVRRDSNQE